MTDAYVPQQILDEVVSERPIEESMARLIDRAEHRHPHPHWEKIRKLSFGDLTSLERWWQRVHKQRPADVPLAGLWFGLFNPSLYDGAPTADLYVCGATQYDPEDADWAVAPAWWPKARRSKSPLLGKLYRIAYQTRGVSKRVPEKLGNHAEYPICLGWAALAVRDLLRDQAPSEVLGSAASLAIVVGFDAGDHVTLGQFGPDGFTGVGTSVH